MTSNEPQQDSGTNFPTISYQQQYARLTEELAPFQGADYDIAELARVLEDNAAKQANQDQKPVSDDVMR